MIRRLVLSAMLFVLVWTSTLLHDIAEPDQPLTVSAASPVKSMARFTLSDDDKVFEGHCHDALVSSKSFNLTDRHLQVLKFVALAAAGQCMDRLQLHVGRFDLRGPPIALATSAPKLYLAKRVLLI
jgi:hypothetical protein